MAKRGWLGVIGALLLTGIFPARGPGAGAAKPKDPAEAARWSDLVPLAIRTPFDSYRYPHLDAQGNVTFIADDALNRDSKGNNHGIFRYNADGTLICLVRGGEATVPGGNEVLNTFQGLQMDENGVDFLFNAVDTDEKRGLYHWSKGKLETIARTDRTILPGDKQPLSGIEYGTLHGSRVLYKGSSPGLGVVLVLHDLAGSPDRVLCHGGMPIPGRKEETFQYIGSTNWMSGDSIVFRAASTENPRNSDAKGTAGLYGWFGIKDWSAASAELAPERMRALVDGTVFVPIKDVPKEATFDTFGSAPISGDTVVFHALGDRFGGIFTAKSPDGPVRCIVSSHTKFDGPFKGRFTGFGTYPSVIGQNLVFTATAEEESPDAANGDDEEEETTNNKSKPFKGVFLYRLDRGELFTLTDDRIPLAGKEVASYEIGEHVLVGDQFAVTVTFKDKTSQIFLGAIRPEAYKRLIEGPPAAPKKPVPDR